MMADSGCDKTGYGPSGWDTASREQDRFTRAESRGRTGAETPDPRRLAQDWITLWQSELSAMAADAEVRECWQGLTALWAGIVSAMIRGMPQAQAGGRHDHAGQQTGAADAPRATPAAAASDSRDAEIERLARHVAILERRLADLERGSNSEIHPKRRARRKQPQ